MLVDLETKAFDHKGTIGIDLQSSQTILALYGNLLLCFFLLFSNLSINPKFGRKIKAVKEKP